MPITENGRASGTLSTHGFANVVKGWPFGGVNDNNAILDTGVTFYAGMFGYIDGNGKLQKAVGADNEEPVFILDDYDAYDVIDAALVPVLSGTDYTVETSQVDQDGTYSPGDWLKVDSTGAATYGMLVEGGPTAKKAAWKVLAARTEKLNDGSSVKVVRIARATNTQA